MSPYPDLPGPRLRAMLADALALAGLALAVWLGIRVHHDVDGLAGLGRGVRSAGTGLRTGLDAAASALRGIPLAGGALGGALSQAAASGGGTVTAVGRSGEQAAHHLAALLGLLAWGLPSGVLLALVLPRRLRAIREIGDLRRADRSPEREAHQHLLALRAAVSLPERRLLAHSTDPAGDLLAGRYGGLVEAAYAQAGLRSPGAR